jgi:hypothetical protein
MVTGSPQSKLKKTRHQENGNEESAIEKKEERRGKAFAGTNQY